MQLTKTAIEVIHSLNLDDTSFFTEGLITDASVVSDLLRKLLEISDCNETESSANHLYFIPDDVCQQGKYLDQFYTALTEDHFIVSNDFDRLDRIRADLHELFHLLSLALKKERTFKNPRYYLIDTLHSLAKINLYKILKDNKEKISSDDSINLLSLCFISSIYNLRCLLFTFDKSFLKHNVEWEECFNCLLEDLKLYWFLF